MKYAYTVVSFPEHNRALISLSTGIIRADNPHEAMGKAMAWARAYYPQSEGWGNPYVNVCADILDVAKLDKLTATAKRPWLDVPAPAPEASS